MDAGDTNGGGDKNNDDSSYGVWFLVRVLCRVRFGGDDVVTIGVIVSGAVVIFVDGSGGQ